MQYVPGPVGQEFLDDGSFLKLIMGPIGGGKSSVCLWDLFQRACEQEPYQNVRRTKFIVLRNTLQQLMSTVKPQIDEWFCTLPEAPMGAWRITDKTFEMRFRIPEDGTVVHTEFCLLAADTPDDVRRLLSYQASAAWVEEAREIDPEIFKGVQGRVARFPSRAAGGVTYPGVVCSTNPPPLDTYWQELIDSPPANMKVFIQPPAVLDDGSINPGAENLENLDPEYYPNLLAANTGDWVEVYLKNKFGPGNAGQPVYRASFKRSFHQAESALLAIPSMASPLIVGADNGLQGAVVVMQQDARARVNVLSTAYVSADITMSYERFMDTIVIPHLNAKYPQHRRENFLFVMDPACFQRSQANEATVAQVVTTRGYQAVRASTNDPEKRNAAVEGLLGRATDGKAGLLIDPACTHLLKALEWGYRYKKDAQGQLTLQVVKNHYSHVADAFQYGCLHFNAQFSQTFTAFRTKAREVKHRAYTYA